MNLILNSKCNQRTISLIDLANELGITKPTLIKSLNTLIEKDYIEKKNSGGRYVKNTYYIK